jgi:hypothetical protein
MSTVCIIFFLGHERGCGDWVLVLSLRCDGDVDWVLGLRERMVEYGDEGPDGGEKDIVED